MLVCFIMGEKCGRAGKRGGREGNMMGRGRENTNQDVLCIEKSIFHYKNMKRYNLLEL